MAGVIKNFFKSFNVDDDDYYDDDDEFYDEEDYDEEEETSKSGGLFRGRSKNRYEDEDDYEEDDYDDDYDEKKNSRKSSRTSKVSKSSKITSINNNRKTPGMEVRVIVPSNFNEDTPEIVDNMLEGCTVILNLEGTDVELAQRIIDFSWGVCRALGADLVPLTERRSFFILALPNVNIMGALKKANDSYNISDSL